MGSPPKPWERSGTIAAAAASTSPSAAAASSSPAPTTANPTSTSTSMSTNNAPPSVPARPASFTSPAASTTAPFASPYSTPFNRFGATPYSPYGSSLYGGMGSLGGYGGGGYGYGGYGMNGMYSGGYSGMGVGGMGMGMYGQPGMQPYDPSNPSVTQALESTTATTFALLHSVVQTFAGLAQMLESTFMATHSSFFALAGVVDQFAQLRNALGGVLGLFGLVRWLRDLLTGRRASAREMRTEFREFLNGRPVHGPAAGPSQSPPPPNASKKPLVFFFLAFLGIPYAMHKLVKIIADRAAQQQQQQQQQQQLGGGGAGGAGGVGGAPVTLPNGQVLPPLDPSQLAFARAAFPFQASAQGELSLQVDEIVAIMAKHDPSTGAEVDPRMQVETEWWKGRTREGREGWFPRAFVEVLERRAPEGKKV